MPTLYILAGPNGTGKTTFYYTAVEEGAISKELPFVNVDNIARFDLGGYTEENFIRAGEIAKEKIAALVSAKADFMIESNLAKASDYEWIERLLAVGYDAVLYFLCTAHPDINVDRVNNRVKEGGHHIPEHMVRDRYKMGLIYLKSKLRIFKEAHLVDNTGETVVEMASLADGKIQVHSGDCPEWVEQALFIVRKLHT